MFEKFISNLANVPVEELSDYRAKQELTEFVNAARCMVKILEQNQMESK